MVARKYTTLIQGAGIAGTTLAWWLARAGHKVVVVERSAHLRSGGYKIDVRGTAVGVLDRMGLYEIACSASVGMACATLVDARGRPLATIDGDIYGMREGRDLELLRGDLAHLLYQAGRGEVEYRFGDSITCLDDRGHDVAVSFQRHPPEAFDFVIGADGLHSPVRDMIFGPEERFLRYLGYHVSIYSTPNRLSLDHEERACILPGERMVNVYSSDTTGDAKALFFFASPPLDIRAGGTDASKAWLRHYMSRGLQAERAWIVPQLLEDLLDAQDFYFDALAQVVMNRWTSGRVSILGDAAWCASPASGQGCSLALVGAYILAQAMKDGKPVTRAAYEDRMMPFVVENQKIAHDFGSLLPDRRRKVWMQQQVARLLNWGFGQRILLGPAQRKFRKAANAISLENQAGEFPATAGAD